MLTKFNKILLIIQGTTYERKNLWCFVSHCQHARYSCKVVIAVDDCRFHEAHFNHYEQFNAKMAASQAQGSNSEAIATTAQDSKPTVTSEKLEHGLYASNCPLYAELQLAKAQLEEANLFAKKCQDYISVSAIITDHHVNEMEKFRKGMGSQPKSFKDQEKKQLKEMKDLQLEIMAQQDRSENFHGILGSLGRNVNDSEGWVTAQSKLVDGQQITDYELVQEQNTKKIDVLKEQYAALQIVFQRLSKDRDECKGEMEVLQWKVTELEWKNVIMFNDYYQVLRDKSLLSEEMSNLIGLLGEKNLVEFQFNKMTKLYDSLETNYNELLGEKERIDEDLKKLKSEFLSKEEQSAAKIQNLKSAALMYKRRLCDARAGTQALQQETRALQHEMP